MENPTAVVYARIARAEQQKDTASLDRQVNLLTNYCAISQISIINTYKDISEGMSFNRPAFTEMLYDLEVYPQSFNLLIVERMDRFCRDNELASKMINHLKAKGVQVKTISNEEVKEASDSLAKN